MQCDFVLLICVFPEMIKKKMEESKQTIKNSKAFKFSTL